VIPILLLIGLWQLIAWLNTGQHWFFPPLIPSPVDVARAANEEDAVQHVEPNLIRAAGALGSSRWQTFWRVIIPAAAPGMFVGGRGDQLRALPRPVRPERGEGRGDRRRLHDGRLQEARQDLVRSDHALRARLVRAAAQGRPHRLSEGAAEGEHLD
jgi:hypothetical protein